MTSRTWVWVVAILFAACVPLFIVSDVAYEMFTILGSVGLFACVILVLVSKRSTYHTRGCCRACGFALNGLPECEDGCTVCPECGAAWRLEEREVV